jgi:dihydroflavonol-4-reductase
MMVGTVFVSGGSGYIAGFLIRQLISLGWTVHTSIRNLAQEPALRAVLAVDDRQLSVFAADLMHDDGWAAAIAGCTHVCHVASPFPSGAVKHADELVIPARDGALRVLRASQAAGVKRFIMTSSAAAIAYGHGKGDHVFTEADWTNLNSPDAYPYVRSKTIAERAARDWVGANGGDMAFCTINPVAVLGPVMSHDFSTSIEAVKKLLEGTLPGCPNFGFGIVDVRDTADIHVRALLAPDMAGERFIAAGPFVKMRDIAIILKTGLGQQARKVPTRSLPDVLVKLAARFDPVVRQVVSELGNVRNMDASHAKSVLGWVARPIDETILDTARSLIAQGFVKV